MADDGAFVIAGSTGAVLEAGGALETAASEGAYCEKSGRGPDGYGRSVGEAEAVTVKVLGAASTVTVGDERSIVTVS